MEVYKEKHSKEDVASFIAKLNCIESHHIGYCGEKEEEILDFITNNFSDFDFQTSFTILHDNNGEIIGVIGLDVDAEDKSAELWGPFVKNENKWVLVANDLWNISVSKVGDTIKKYYGFYNKENNNAHEFMMTLNATYKDDHIILKANQSNFKSMPTCNMHEITSDSYKDFIYITYHFPIHILMGMRY